MKQIFVILLSLIVLLANISLAKTKTTANTLQGAGSSPSHTLLQSLGNYNTYSADFTQTTSGKKTIMVEKSQGEGHDGATWTIPLGDYST